MAKGVVTVLTLVILCLFSEVQEIAPILGLSDVIVDIVETGTTLKENDLDVVETIVPISARLIANKSAYKFKGDLVNTVVEGIEKQMQNK